MEQFEWNLPQDGKSRAADHRRLTHWAGKAGNLLRPGRGAEYCDQFLRLSICVSVCLCLREHISGTAGPIFTKFCVQMPCSRGSILLWRCCDTLCAADVLTPRETAVTLVFWRQHWLVGGAPSVSNIRPKWPTFFVKRRLRHIRWCSVQGGRAHTYSSFK